MKLSLAQRKALEWLAKDGPWRASSAQQETFNMVWKLIATAPTHGEQILVGFQGQLKWFSYVADAHGKDTGQHMSFAPPTHWTKIIPPEIQGKF